MPLFLDRHDTPGASPELVAAIHQQDLALEKEFGIKCLTCWHDLGRGSAFCLIDAPDAESIQRLHEKTHGNVPNRVVAVDATMVEAFL